MNTRRFACLTAGLAGLAAAVLWLNAFHPAQARPNLICVKQAGTRCPGQFAGNCYDSVQTAINNALPGDEILLAAGVYTSSSSTYTSSVGTVATIYNKLRLVGGYDSACTGPAPGNAETVFDAQSNGPVVVLQDAPEVVLEKLTLIHGDGTGRCGATRGCGGGIYAVNSGLAVQDSIIRENVASQAPGSAVGGGIYALNTHLTVLNSRIISNTAGAEPTDYYGHGGGIYVQKGEAHLVENLVQGNLGSFDYSGVGGIELVEVVYGEVLNNTIVGNRSTISSTYWSSAGGIELVNNPFVYVAGNRIEHNGCDAACYGGGISIMNSTAEVERNVIRNNSSGMFWGHGAGVSIYASDVVTLTNNLITDNDPADNADGGVYVGNYAADPAIRGSVRFFNNTIVRNGPYWMVMDGNANLYLVNNLISDHTTGLLHLEPLSGTVTADSNLFWNQSDPALGVRAIFEDPRLDPYDHLSPGSPAVDAGLSLPWLVVDLKGLARPQFGLWDIGADEWTGARLFLPLQQ